MPPGSSGLLGSEFSKDSGGIEDQAESPVGAVSHSQGLGR